jgi:hypothetical protein
VPITSRQPVRSSSFSAHLARKDESRGLISEAQVIEGGDNLIIAASLPNSLHQAARAWSRENEVKHRLRHRWSSNL